MPTIEENSIRSPKISVFHSFGIELIAIALPVSSIALDTLAPIAYVLHSVSKNVEPPKIDTKSQFFSHFWEDFRAK